MKGQVTQRIQHADAGRTKWRDIVVQMRDAKSRSSPPRRTLEAVLVAGLPI